MKNINISRLSVHHGAVLTVVAVAVFSAAQLLMPAHVHADHINGTDFVMTVDTSKSGSPGAEFTIPTTGIGYHYNVDCDGDGAPEATNQTGNYTCQYATPGVRQVRISGAFPRIHFNNSGDKLKLISIDQWGNNQWKDMNAAFYGAANMDVKATDIPDVSHVTNMSNMFNGATSLKGESANWANWNTAKVRAMDNTFYGAQQFNQSIDSWNTSEVRYMSGTFFNAKAFNQPLNSWDTRNVTSLKNTFNGADKFNQPLNNWSTEHVTSMLGTFAGAKAFNQDITGWDMAEVTETRAMFQGATAFNQEVSKWITTKLKDASHMFNGATGFNQSLANWNVTSLEKAENMFHGVGLSLQNYDATLQSWGAQAVKQNVPFSGGKSQYCLATDERKALTTANGWTITDAGRNCEQYFPTAVEFTGVTSIDENSPVGIELGTLEGKSPLGAADSFTYATGCAGNFPQDGDIEIEGNKVKLKKSPDYEANRQLKFCVRATNKLGETIDKSITLNIVNKTALSYDANGATGGTVPVSTGEINAVGAYVPASANTGSLVKTGYTFDGWNTAANGLGTAYKPGDMVPLAADVTLYAQWRDTIPPVKPAAAPDLVSKDDSGVSATDNITNRTRPSFTVRCTESGSRITLYVDGTPNGTVNCDDAGEVTVQAATPLAEGDRTITYTETDRSGNESPKSPSLTVTVDTTRPQTPVISVDDITDDNTLNSAEAAAPQTIKGVVYHAAVGDKISITIGTRTHSVALGAGGTFTLTVSGADLVANPDRKLQFAITTEDIAGNSAFAQTELSYTVDNDPVPTPPAAVFDAGTDSGISNTDALTNANEPRVTVQCPAAGAQVTVYVDGAEELVHDCVDATPFSTAIGPLADGLHVLTYKLKLVNGNESPLSKELPITIDTKAPEGDIKTVRTDKDTPKIIGVVDDPEALLELDIQGVTYHVTNLKNGLWELPEGKISPALPEGTYAMTLRMIDKAGNVKTVHGELAVAYAVVALPPANKPAKDQATRTAAPNTGHQRNTMAGLIVAIGGGIVAIAGAAFIIMRKRKG